VARDGEPLAAGARHLLEHLAGGSGDGSGGPPAGPVGGGEGTERFHLTAEGTGVISSP